MFDIGRYRWKKKYFLLIYDIPWNKTIEADEDQVDGRRLVFVVISSESNCKGTSIENLSPQ